MNHSLVVFWILFSPLIGLFLLLFVPKDKKRHIRIIGVSTAFFPLFGVLPIWWGQGTAWSQWDVSIPWLNLGKWTLFGEGVYRIGFDFGLDGISFLMVALTALLSAVAAIASLVIRSEVKGFFLLFLLLETSMLGVFLADNALLFFLFFEFTLVGTFFLIGKWGGFDKEKAAYRFLIYNGLGSAFLLLVVVALFAGTGTVRFDELQFFLGDETYVSDKMKGWLLVAIFLAFGLKLPIVGLHRWVLSVHVEAPPSVVILHAGVLLKIGAYGLYRFGVELFPTSFSSLQLVLVVWGVVNFLLGAFAALVQTELRRMLAYASISHMGLVLMGIGAFNEAGLQGAMYQVVSHSLLAAIFFFIIGVLEEREKGTSFRQLSGLMKTTPKLATCFFIAGLASLGLPGLSGFISELMTFIGVFDPYPMVGVLGIGGILLTVVYMIRAIVHMLFVHNESTDQSRYRDMNRLELLSLGSVTVAVIILGVYPAVVLQWINDPIQQLLASL
ncbi:complex I subunit 4 family protein [Aeribacillus pallidus]|uniref:complex I subunit 4 family protein n=1 Tax=Aeribacillus pallidus TaxID=33936 RepID=UPI003D204A98